MEKLINMWVRSQKPSPMLGHHKVGTGPYFEIYEYMDPEENFCVCGFFYEDNKVRAILRDQRILMLKGGTSEELVKVDESQPLEKVLESCVIKFKTKAEWDENRAKRVSQKQMKMVLDKYFEEYLIGLRSASWGNFDVLLVEHDKYLATVFFKKRGLLQQPIRLVLGDVSAVRKRDYGDDTEGFELFVEGLGEITGGVVWA